MNMSSEDKVEEIHSWKLIGLIILSLRFVQGWIFWGGGSRRFIYDPHKLDPYSTQWMANKLQSAMPGALLGFEQLISFLLQHFYLLYASIILFSLVELISGLALLFGFFTRLAAFITVLISITLMIIFGWQGTTCMDEWTMAVSNLAIGLTLTLSGSLSYSVDSVLLKRFWQKKWFLVLASGPLSFNQLKKVGISFLVFTVFFTLATYNYYRGAIFSAYHSGPVSAYEYHLKLSNGKINSDGSVSFNLYVDAGPSASPTYIIRIELLNSEKEIIEQWDRKQLNKFSNDQVKNKYAYNRITKGLYGIVAPVSAEATITLPSKLNLKNGIYILRVFTIDGQLFDCVIKK